MVNIPKVKHLLSIGRNNISTSYAFNSTTKDRPPWRLDTPNGFLKESVTCNYPFGRPAAFHTAEEALTFKRLCLEKLDRHLLKKNNSVHTHGRSKVLGTKTRH